MDVKKLSNEEVYKLLENLSTWKIKESKLYKLYKFKNFNQAMSFMMSVAMECEKMNHHPEWYNVYGNVEVNLTTHRVAGITELDFKLAGIMDKLSSNLNPRKD